MKEATTSMKLFGRLDYGTPYVTKIRNNKRHAIESNDRRLEINDWRYKILNDRRWK